MKKAITPSHMLTRSDNYYGRCHKAREEDSVKQENICGNRNMDNRF